MSNTADGESRVQRLIQELNENLIGMGDVIDEVGRRVSGWNMVRDFMPKPMVICMWGPTGCGKTRVCDIVTKHMGRESARINASRYDLDRSILDGIGHIGDRAPIISIHDIHKLETRRSGYDFPVFFELLDTGSIPNAEVGRFRSALILMTGNLDEVYDFGSLAIDRAFTADQAVDMTKGVASFSMIRSAILSRLKTEHFARLGSAHIICPFLSSSDLRTIANNSIGTFSRDIEDSMRLRLSFDGSCTEWVMSEGATATHGARPVIDTARDIVANVVSEIATDASRATDVTREFSISVDGIGTDVANLRISADGIERSVSLVSKASECELGRIDRTAENVAVAVHEAGHVITYATCRGQIPVMAHFTARNDRDAVIVGAGSEKPFFMSDVIPYAAANLGGLAAQHVILGEESWTLRVYDDIDKASLLISNSVLMTSAKDHQPLMNIGVIAPYQNGGRTVNLQADQGEKESQIRGWMERAWEMAMDAVSTHRDALIEIAETMLDHGMIRSILSSHGVPIAQRHAFSIGRSGCPDRVG